MLETCGDAESQLAVELSQHEVFVEREIVDPLCNIAEVRASRVCRGTWLAVSQTCTVIGAFDTQFVLEIRGVSRGRAILRLRERVCT